MTDIQTEPMRIGGEILPAAPSQIDAKIDTLSIDPEISFNDWRRYGEGLLVASGSVQWYLGDWWNFGQEAFGKSYYQGLDELAHAHASLLEYARVARAFPPRREASPPGAPHRISEISFVHHQICASIKDPDERMAWLEDVLRQGWSSRALRDELQRAEATVVRVPALQVRLVEEHYRIAIAAAERRDMDPRDWVLEAIREKRDREAPELEAA